MAITVAFVGLIVIDYSRAYLAGDPRQGRFFKYLCLTIASVLTLIASGNLALFAVAWIATSLCLHQLLLFYPERYGAQMAAHKKFVFSRIGDGLLLAAVILTAVRFQTLDIRQLIAMDLPLTQVLPIAMLLAGSALIKSAQVPFHSWLPEVMETPTPVSALLHAGIINAGGYLILRLSHLVGSSEAALHLIALAGAVTALFGGLVMTTQPSIKVGLAWSTVGQMGFMMLECGLGAFSAAMLHLVAHSLYKAYGFLSSGSAVDQARATIVAPVRPVPLWVAAIGLAGAGGLSVLLFAQLGLAIDQRPGEVLLGSLVAMTMVRFVLAAAEHTSPMPALLRAVPVAVAATVTYSLLQQGADWLLEGAVARPLPADGFDIALAAILLILFGVTLLFGLAVRRADRSRDFARLYVAAANGFYIGAWTDRLLVNIWPVGRPTVRHPSARISSETLISAKPLEVQS